MRASKSKKPLSRQSPLQVEEALEISESFSALFAKLSDPSPQAYARLTAQMDGILTESKGPITNSPAALYRTGRALYYGDQPTMKELGASLGIPSYAATRMIEWWVENGLAERLADPADRRIVRIQLTDNGRRFHEAAEGFTYDVIANMLECLSDDERATLVALLSKVASHLKAS